MKNQKPFMFIGHQNKLFAETRIHDLDTGEVRTVNHRDGCRTECERSAYDECISRHEVITMGTTIVEPIN